jgi:hypothetical protein
VSFRITRAKQQVQGDPALKKQNKTKSTSKQTRKSDLFNFRGIKYNNINILHFYVSNNVLKYKKKKEKPLYD